MVVSDSSPLDGILHRILTVLHGVGPIKESNFRSSGKTQWSDVRNGEGQLSIFPDALDREIQLAQNSLEKGDVFFFKDRLPNALRYLLCLEFPQKVTFLDIETTGLSKIYHSITLIGWSSEKRYESEFVGRGASPSSNFIDHLEMSPLIVTFNGSIFDLPFLESNIRLPPLISVDLRYLTRRLGYSGGQKLIEAELGIRRIDTLSSVRGEDAPGLWFKATRGDRDALEKLVEYNFLDVSGMAQILQQVVPDALESDGLLDLMVPAAGGLGRIPVPELKKGWRRNSPRWLREISKQNLPLVRFEVSGEHSCLPVIGIDLTGSSKRLTGVANIIGNEVEVSSLATDDEIVRYVTDINPQLVSIDAPLSLPRGRISVFDDDPSRATAGIMRVSERELKRRGVNVYPCLLPSMQGLTARGIRLATEFRRQGIPTIESYPGGAQDILAMPRKGVGTAFLEESLKDVGLELGAANYSHDELDAITSAIVGVMFLNGQFEALGDFDEDPMIVPLLLPKTKLPRQVIAVSGDLAAGKTTSSRWFESKGFSYHRYSEVIEYEAIRLGHGAQLNRAVLQEVGEQLHLNLGQRVIGKKLLMIAGEPDQLVVDGLRFLEDFSFLKETYGSRLFHLHIRAPLDIRRIRLAKRDGIDADVDSIFHHPVESESRLLDSRADAVIENSSTLEHLFSKLSGLATQNQSWKYAKVVAA